MLFLIYFMEEQNYQCLKHNSLKQILSTSHNKLSSVGKSKFSLTYFFWIFRGFTYFIYHPCSSTGSVPRQAFSLTNFYNFWNKKRSGQKVNSIEFLTSRLMGFEFFSHPWTFQQFFDTQDKIFSSRMSRRRKVADKFSFFLQKSTV